MGIDYAKLLVILCDEQAFDTPQEAREVVFTGDGGRVEPWLGKFVTWLENQLRGDGPRFLKARETADLSLAPEDDNRCLDLLRSAWRAATDEEWDF